jgi:hypothetical protein
MDHQEPAAVGPSPQEQRRQEQEAQMGIYLDTLELIFQDYAQMDDPVLRHTLFLDKVSIALRVAIGIAKVAVMERSTSVAVQQRVDRVGNTLLSGVKDMAQWIRQPIYSPDHPYGAGQMQACVTGLHATQARMTATASTSAVDQPLPPTPAVASSAQALDE